MRKTEHSLEEHFDKRAAKYDSIITSWVNNEVILELIFKYVQNDFTEDCKILDLGAGTGAVSKYLLKKSNENVISITAVDISYEMLNKITDERITKVRCNAEKLPFNDMSYDIVVSRQCLHYVENVDEAIKEVNRVLKQKGLFILAQIVPHSEENIEYWNKLIEFRQKLRKHFFSKEQWIEIVSNAGLTFLEASECSHIASINNWKIKYQKEDQKEIEEYARLLLNAPDKYKNEYDVREEEHDITSKQYWMIARFQKAV